MQLAITGADSETYSLSNENITLQIVAEKNVTPTVKASIANISRTTVDIKVTGSTKGLLYWKIYNINNENL